MAEAQLQQFLEKIKQLNAFVALSEANPSLRRQLQDCTDHQGVVNLAREHGFEIGRRWGEGPASPTTPPSPQPGQSARTMNLLAGECPAAGRETSTVLLEQSGLRLERIHSCQASSPEGFWYDQSEHEWVLLLQGSALLEFEDETTPRKLCAGDSFWIAAHHRHRLVATDPAPGCVWLALFWPAAS